MTIVLWSPTRTAGGAALALLLRSPHGNEESCPFPNSMVPLTRIIVSKDLPSLLYSSEIC
jgi:hypothetical protein